MINDVIPNASVLNISARGVPRNLADLCSGLSAWIISRPRRFFEISFRDSSEIFDLSGVSSARESEIRNKRSNNYGKIDNYKSSISIRPSAKSN